MSCVNWCVVAFDWYLPPTFFRSGVSGAGVLMHALCRCYLVLLGGVCQWWAGWLKLTEEFAVDLGRYWR